MSASGNDRSPACAAGEQACDLRGRRRTIVEMKPSYRCNQECCFCVWAGRKRQPRMTLEQFRVTLRHAVDTLSPSCIVLSGGEPTAWAHFGEAMDCIRSLGRVGAFHLHTNATLIRRRKAQMAVPVAEAQSATVGLHGHEAAVHDRISGRPGSFAAAVEGIGLLQDLGYTIRIDSVICTHNVAYLRELTAFALGIGARTAEIRIPVVGPGLSPESFTPPAAELRRRLQAWMAAYHSEPRARLLASEARCFGTVRREFPVQEFDFHFFDGQCAGDSDAQARQQLVAIWSGAYGSYAKAKACGTCIYDDRCDGFSPYEVSLGLDRYRPVDLDTILAAIRRAGAERRHPRPGRRT